MDLRLRGKKALVTGGSQGIGLACASAFAAEGCDLHLAARGADKLEAERARLVGEFGVAVVCHPCDLSASGAAAALAAACGNVDILVNSAGNIPLGRLGNTDEETWRRAWDLKIFGCINMTREIYARMRNQRSGVIINIIGLSGERHRPEYLAGTSGNSALMAFSRALGAESVDYGVRVIGINPGRVETERHIEHLKIAAERRLGDSNRWKEIRAEMRVGLPFGRAARPDEVGDLVAFLASERASYMSATVVTMDAGQSLRARADV